MTDYDGEGMTPEDTGPTTVQFVGDVLRAFTEHGLAWERRANNATAFYEGLLRRQRVMQRDLEAVDEALARYKEEVAELTSNLAEAVVLLGNHGLNARDWTDRRDGLVAQWEVGYGKAPQTDAQPTAPVATEPGCQHKGCVLTHPHSGPAVLTPSGEATCKCPRSEFGTTVCQTGVAEERYGHEDALRFKEAHEGACKTVAEMHAAAFGGVVRGPERGVVEDIQDLYNRCQAAEANTCGHAPDGGNHPTVPSAG